MGTATVEVSGAQATRWAGQLQAALAANAQPEDDVSPVEVQRSVDTVIAVIGLVFAGIGTAKTMWEWWRARRPEGVTVRILLRDGTRLDLSHVDQDQLVIAFERDQSEQG